MENNSEIKNERIVYADVLRILSTFAVIVLHTAASKWYDTPLKSFNWQVINFYDSVTRWAVPVFFMLSGMFFLEPKKEISVKDIYLKYILRIVTALIFWGLAYNFLTSLTDLKNFAMQGDVKLFVKKMIKLIIKIPCGPAWYHLWFLYSLIGLYIMTPIFRFFSRNANKKDFDYLMIIFCLLGSILPLINFCLRTIHPLLNINFSIPEFTGFAGYFFAGYYFANFKIKKSTKNIIFIFGILSIVFTVLSVSFMSIKKDKGDGYFYGNMLPNTMCAAFFVFLSIKDFFERHSINEKIRSMIFKISKLTFGIYLIHDFFNIIFAKIGLTAVLGSPIYMVPLRSILSFMLSALIILGISKIPVLKKYII